MIFSSYRKPLSRRWRRTEYLARVRLPPKPCSHFMTRRFNGVPGILPPKQAIDNVSFDGCPMCKVRSGDCSRQAAWRESTQGRSTHDRGDHLAARQRCQTALDPNRTGRLKSCLSAVPPLGAGWHMGQDHGALVADGEPKRAFACSDGTIARTRQKTAGAHPSKPMRSVCDSLAKLGKPRRLWAAQKVGSAAKSSRMSYFDSFRLISAHNTMMSMPA